MDKLTHKGEVASPPGLGFVISPFPFPCPSSSVWFQRIFGLLVVGCWFGFLGRLRDAWVEDPTQSRVRLRAVAPLLQLDNFTTQPHQLHTTRRLLIPSSSGLLCTLTGTTNTTIDSPNTLLREFLGLTPTSKRRQLPHHGVAQLQHKHCTTAVDGLVRRRREGETASAFAFSSCSSCSSFHHHCL